MLNTSTTTFLRTLHERGEQQWMCNASATTFLTTLHERGEQQRMLQCQCHHVPQNAA